MKRLLVVFGLISILLLVSVTFAVADNSQESRAGMQSEKTLQSVGAEDGVKVEAEAAAAKDATKEEEHGEDHGKAKLVNFGWRIFNFVVLFVILYKLSAKAIRNFFAGGRESIKASLEGAIAAKEEAEKRLREHSDRLDKATSEIQGIADMIKAQGLAEKEKIIEEAKKTAEKMKEDSKARMDQEFKEALKQLRTEAAELSVKMADEILKKNIKKKDHENMVNDFLDGMVSRN
ncbi:MAG: F0F1 ATP synthase subunit B [Deltaproteobacteria bacterium]|nr:F0F1 ATP synthase subunit B [Deltaproteobacteria bacterium]MBW2648559.1 F0F1 ATP synthase subunit B [Deltaproteobacteria bacterium]